MFRFAQHDKLQIASCRLLAFDGFEQRFEIAFAEALRAFALNDFKKERWSIFAPASRRSEGDNLHRRDQREFRVPSTLSVLRRCDRRDRAAYRNNVEGTFRNSSPRF